MLVRNTFNLFYQLLLMLILFVTGLYANHVERFWSYKLAGNNIDASVAIGDLDRDGFSDIVAASTAGMVIALDGYGREIWKIGMEEKISIAPTVMDVTGDSGLEVLVLTQSGKIHCLEGMTGDLIWENSSLGKIKWASMTIVTADINQDGSIEIISGDSEGKLLCLNGNGKKIWEYNESEGIGSAPAVGDLDGDGLEEIIIASEETPLICLNHNGEVQWRYKPQGEVLDSGRKREVTAPVIWDINGNGTAEIITGMGFNLVAVDSKGKLVWSIPIKNRIDSAISIADADGDGEVEIYAVDLSGNLISVTSAGKSKWSANLGSRARRSPTIADVDGDGIVEILVAGYSSQMQIFDPDGNIEEGLLVKGGTNAAATITDLLGDGGLCALIPELSGNLVVYRWTPVVKKPEILWPEYRAWASRTAGEYSQNKRKISSDLITDDLRNKTVIDKQSFIDNLSKLKKKRDEIKELIPQLPDKKGLLERVYYLDAAIEQSQNPVENVSNLTPIKRRALRDNLNDMNIEFLRWLKITKQAVATDNIIAAYAANPWAPFGGMDEIIEERTPGAKISVEAFQGEFESAAVNLFNFSGSARTIRVLFDDFSGPNGAESVSTDKVFTLCETIDVPTQDGDLSADALPELNSGNLLVIPAWDGRQLWFTINTSSLTPGIWRAKIHLKSLDIQFVETEVELIIKIWDIPLPKEQPLNLCNWSGTLQPEGTFDDQIVHGTNVFTRTVPPKATFDELGQVINIDFSEHDNFMAAHALKGTILFHSLVSLTGPSPAFSPAWLKAYRSFIPVWIVHLNELGYGYENFAFYPVDEPGLEHGKNLNRFMKWAKLVRECDPKIRIYANPVALITMKQLEEMVPYVDIWAPMQTQIFPKEKLEFIHSTKTHWWNYDCADNAKHLSPLAYYRGQAWMCWHFGHTGIGFYTYYRGPDFWFQPESGFEYAMIYKGRGVVTSKRWEAVRDGVEDYTLLHALKMLVEGAEEAGAKSDLVEKSREVLNKKVAAIVNYSDEPKLNSLYSDTPERQANSRTLADKRWEMILNIRRDMAGLFYLLQ